MLILDYQRWKHHDIPHEFYQYKDGSCPCIKTSCIVTPSCSIECKPFLGFVYTRVTETISFIRDKMTTDDYYKIVETAETYTAGAVTGGLISLYYDEANRHKAPMDELKVIFGRYVYCMHRAQQIHNNRKAKNPNALRSGDFYIDI